MVWNGKPATFEGALTSVSSVLDDRPAKLKVNFASDALNTSFEGSATFRDTMDAEGILSAQSPSVRGLARWMGMSGAAIERLRSPAPPRASSAPAARPRRSSNAEISLDGAIARGQISVENGGARPRVNANLKLTELDLNTYRHDGSLSEPPIHEPAAEGAAPSEAHPRTAPTRSNDLLRREPLCHARAARQGLYAPRGLERRALRPGSARPGGCGRQALRRAPVRARHQGRPGRS